jgi:single-strand DNA-binding protein
MNETIMTFVGNLVADPEMRYTPQGQPVARFRVTSTPRFRDNTTGERKDSEALFLTCNAWRQLAENVAESLERGSRVIVSGRLRQRSDEKDGEKRTVHELEADKIGPSLRNATAKVSKVTRANGERGPGQPPGRREGRGPVGQPGRRRLLRRAAVLAQVPETPVRTSPPGGRPAVHQANGTSRHSTGGQVRQRSPQRRYLDSDSRRHREMLSCRTARAHLRS